MVSSPTASFVFLIFTSLTNCQSQTPWSSENYPNPKSNKTGCKISPTSNGFICDPDQVLGAEETSEIDQNAADILAETEKQVATAQCPKNGISIFVALSKKLASFGAKVSDAEIRAFADSLVSQWTTNGDPCYKAIVIILSINDKKIWMEPNSELEKYLSKNELNSIAKSSVQLNHMRAGKYKDALLGYMKEIKDKYVKDLTATGCDREGVQLYAILGKKLDSIGIKATRLEVKTFAQEYLAKLGSQSTTCNKAIALVIFTEDKEIWAEPTTEMEEYISATMLNNAISRPNFYAQQQSEYETTLEDYITLIVKTYRRNLSELFVMQMLSNQGRNKQPADQAPDLIGNNGSNFHLLGISHNQWRFIHTGESSTRQQTSTEPSSTSVYKQLTTPSITRVYKQLTTPERTFTQIYRQQETFLESSRNNDTGMPASFIWPLVVFGIIVLLLCCCCLCCFCCKALRDCLCPCCKDAPSYNRDFTPGPVHHMRAPWGPGPGASSAN